MGLWDAAYYIFYNEIFFFFCWQGRLQGWKVGMRGGANEWIGVHDVKFNQLEPIQSCKKKKYHGPSDAFD